MLEKELTIGPFVLSCIILFRIMTVSQSRLIISHWPRIYQVTFSKRFSALFAERPMGAAGLNSILIHSPF